MQDFLNDLSTTLKYIKSEKKGDTIHIYCESNAIPNKRIHSRKERKVKDIPFGSYKTILHLITKKYFNDDPNINKLTTSETFDFINSTGRRTKRLDKYLMNLYKETSAIGLERVIKVNIADVSDSTILRILKKNDQNRL